jgi:hypothetical protein
MIVMALVKRPLLFSAYYNIPAEKLDEYGLIDPFVNVDTQLFIDPILLSKSSIPLIKHDAHEGFKKHFDNIIRLLIISNKEGDVAWRTAQAQLNLREPPENGLGYGGSGRSGNSRPNEIRDMILRTTKEIVDLGARDPEMISLMGFFEKRVGPDTISDFTSRVITLQLAMVTRDFCTLVGIPTKVSPVSPEIGLPHHIGANGRERAIVLVPRDVVRELPTANDWSDIEQAVSANAAIRAQVNFFLAGIARPTVVQRKAAIRSAVLQSAGLFEIFVAAVKEYASFYDPNDDSLGYYKLKEILRGKLDDFKAITVYDLSGGVESIRRLVHDTIEMFKHHVENGNLWEALWINGEPKKERAAQLIYYAISDCFCMANNIDISPEANMGGGPIDFKYSKGYKARVLVEMKRSMGSVVHGYETQLEIYKDASRTFCGIFVIINCGGMGNKLAKIQGIRSARIAAGEPASDIVVIDARPKASASKRK